MHIHVHIHDHSVSGDRELLLTILNTLNQMNEKIELVKQALDQANETIANVSGVVVKIDADVTNQAAQIQALKDQIGNGGPAVTEADLDSLLEKSAAVTAGLASLKNAAEATDAKVEDAAAEEPAPGTEG